MTSIIPENVRPQSTIGGQYHEIDERREQSISEQCFPDHLGLGNFAKFVHLLILDWVNGRLSGQSLCNFQMKCHIEPHLLVSDTYGN
jgi:hypothetical protein